MTLTKKEGLFNGGSSVKRKKKLKTKISNISQNCKQEWMRGKLIKWKMNYTSCTHNTVCCIQHKNMRNCNVAPVSPVPFSISFCYTIEFIYLRILLLIWNIYNNFEVSKLLKRLLLRLYLCLLPSRTIMLKGYKTNFLRIHRTQTHSNNPHRPFICKKLIKKLSHQTIHLQL